MPEGRKHIINVRNIPVSVVSGKEDDFICITDLAKAKEGNSRAADIIKNWIRSRTTIEFLGTREKMNNPAFKVVEFDHFKIQAGLHTFVLTPGQWVEKTGAIGIYAKSGRLRNSGGIIIRIKTAISVTIPVSNSWSFFPISKA